MRADHRCTCRVHLCEELSPGALFLRQLEARVDAIGVFSEARIAVVEIIEPQIDEAGGDEDEVADDRPRL